MRRFVKYGLLISCLMTGAVGCNGNTAEENIVIEESAKIETITEQSTVVEDNTDVSKDLSDIELMGDFEASKDLAVPNTQEYNISDEMSAELFKIEPTDEKSLDIKKYLTDKYDEEFTINMTGEEELSHLLIALVTDDSGVSFTATKNLIDGAYMDTYSQNFFIEPISEYVKSVASDYENSVYVEIYDTQASDLREKNFAEITQTDGVSMNVGVTITVDAKNANSGDLVRLCDELKSKFGESQFVYTLYNDDTGNTIWWDMYSGFPSEEDVTAFFEME
ncbi:MAG: hypothetical protein IJE43_02375 [Alphaproteobacteria bacterium]|nr:hypothetical protein [Alphaproteobacteria bacterium]